MSAEQTTQIDVPVRFAAEVRRFVAFLTTDRAESNDRASATRVPADGIADYPLWPDAEIVRLANAGTTTARNYRLIMGGVVANDRVGDWVSIDQLTEWTGLKRSEVSTFRTHLYRYIHARIAPDALAPFTAASGVNLRPARGRGREVFYRVSAECAEQWARVQSELKETH